MAPVAERIGPFVILEKLRHQGMAEVYRAYEETTRRQVALKVLPAELATRADVLGRFVREAQIAGSLNHNHIVRLWSASTDAPPYYLALEFLPGGTLADRLARGALSVEETLEIIGPICQAVHEAHAHGVVHRDLKPANIMFNAHGLPVLTDFGIARARDLAQVTMVGGRVGTVEYMSPEQARGKQVGPRSDLYSLAAVVYHMLTGSPPFRHEDPMTVMGQIIDGPPPNPRALNPAVPPAVAAVLLRGMAKQPAARYPSAVAFHRALREAYWPSQGPAPRPGQDSDVAPPERRPRPARATSARSHIHRRVILAALLLVVLAMAAVLSALWDRAPGGGAVSSPGAPGAGPPGVEQARAEEQYREALRQLQEARVQPGADCAAIIARADELLAIYPEQSRGGPLLAIEAYAWMSRDPSGAGAGEALRLAREAIDGGDTSALPWLVAGVAHVWLGRYRDARYAASEAGKRLPAASPGLDQVARADWADYRNLEQALGARGSSSR